MSPIFSVASRGDPGADEQSLAVLAQYKETYYPEGIPESRFVLARALRDTGKRPQALAAAQKALAEYEAIDPVKHSAEIAEIRAWLAKQ